MSAIQSGELYSNALNFCIFSVFDQHRTAARKIIDVIRGITFSNFLDKRSACYHILTILKHVSLFVKKYYN